jgi:tetratricopeptide (TPR) repeat protein
MNSAELIKQGQEMMSTLRLPEAEQAFGKALELDSHSSNALIWLGRVAILQDKDDEALKWLDRALSSESDFAEAIALKAVYFMKSENYERAIELLEQAIPKNPNFEMIHSNLGKCYLEIGEFEKAEAVLRKAIRIDPNQFQGHGQLSRVLIQTGRIKEGIEEMVKAIRINPFYLKGYLVLGALYEKAGKQDLVMRLYRSGIRQNPNAIQLREKLCALYMSKGDFKKASIEALEILKRRNGYEDYLRLGNIAVTIHKFDDGEKIFKSSIEVDPSRWEAHYNLAELYLVRNSMDQARIQYLSAVEKNSDSYKPFNGLGYFELMVNHNTDKAIRMLKQAIEFAPEQPEPKLNIALAYSRKREFLLAEKYSKEVLKISKTGTKLHKEAERLLKKIQQEKGK